MEADQKQTPTTLHNILLAILFIAGAALRLYDVTDEPMELHPARQMRAAIIARSFYFEDNPDIPADQRDFAAFMRTQTGVIEPPIIESLMTAGYRLMGKEAPWIGRLVSITAWMLGGWGVYQLSRQLSSPVGALFALTYYLFLPYGVRFSRVLLPDVMMVSACVLALWALTSWQTRRTWGWAVAAGLLTGFAIFVKTVAGIILIVPFALYLLSAQPLKKTLKDVQVWVILLLAATPTVAYYIWGIFIDGRLATQFSGRFFPELWRNIVVYKSWGLRIIQEFWLPAFLAGLAGIVLTKRKENRWLLFGWWAGYFIFGMLFIYFIWTHDYYHLPMVPLLAVSLAPAITWIEEFAARKGWLTAALSLIAAAGLVIIGIGSYQSIRFFNQQDYRVTRQNLESLGEYLDTLPEGRLIALTQDYETSFRFYSMHPASHWPRQGDLNFQQLQGQTSAQFDELWEERAGDAAYFLVTDFKELNRQPTLQAKLQGAALLQETPDYQLYELTP